MAESLCRVFYALATSLSPATVRRPCGAAHRGAPVRFRYGGGGLEVSLHDGKLLVTPLFQPAITREELLKHVTPHTLMTHDLGLANLAKVIQRYPTQVEAIRKTDDLLNRTHLTTSMKQLVAA